MNIPSKHMHSPSWDQSAGRRKETHPPIAQSYTHNGSTGDSFLNRVFGYHSGESSRAASPVPSYSSVNQHSKSNTSESYTHSSNHTKRDLQHSSSASSTVTANDYNKTRHIRNSSTGNIPILNASPLSIPYMMQRRRSFDGTEANNTLKKPTPTPIPSTSARVANSVSSNHINTTAPNSAGTNVRATAGSQKGINVPRINTAAVPFPRGGRQIGSTLPTPTEIANPQTIGRSNSIEHVQYRVEDQPKKRHLFRFGKKKSNGTTTASSTTSATGSSSTSITTGSTAYSQSSLNSNAMTASDVQRQYYQNQSANEKKKSASSNINVNGNLNRKGLKDNGKDNLFQLKLDQNFERMDGIVNKDYYRNMSYDAIPPTLIIPDDGSRDNESWAPPDSWGVQPASIISGAASLMEDDQVEFEDYRMDVPTKNANIKIHRPDRTYNTLHVPLNSTTQEILKKLESKYFLNDIKRYTLVMKRQNIERELKLHERPLQIQKMLQEQMGYMDQDNIDDNSYLVYFQMVPKMAAPLIEDRDLGHHVVLPAHSFSTIPIYLYKPASKIKSLDLSNNILFELPVDFVQRCTSLSKLYLSNNDYTVLPSATQHIASLEHLHISGNQLHDLDHARLDKLSQLRTLRAINNKLETLPEAFGSCFQHLTTLFISNNSFTKFPMVICQITSLAYLDISFNKIQMFPEEIGQLTNLIGLFAIANRITGGLPSSLMNLTKLRELDLRQNLISDLDVVSHLPSLEILLVDYNSTSIVNFEVKSLRQLKMYKNHLTQFNLSCLPGPESSCLTELNLSNCKLSSLPETLFSNTKSLERLVLDSNTLSTLPSSIGQLQRLVKLSIQNNNLDSLPSEIGRLTELKILDAQKNNLKMLPKEIWLCASLQTLNCSSNLLESFPPPSSAPLVTGDNVSEMTLVCNGDDDMMPIMPPTLNAGQGVIKRLDYSINSSTTSNATFNSLSSAASFNYNSEQSLHPHHTNSQSAQSQSSQQASLIPPPPPPPQKSTTPPPPPNFNPPSFFTSPQNHPPPLSLSLRQLFLGDNRLTDDVWSPLLHFSELRTLNLSFNDLYEVPPESLCHQHLYELYLSGNQLTSLPADDIERLQYLRVLAVNGNKLQTLPAEIGKLRKLLVLDVGNNVLKYNIANWPYDWNWNWNLGLKYLNLSGNKRLEIQKTHPDPNNPKDKDLSDFSALTRLRMLGLMDITILGVSIPEEFHDRRVRTSPSEVNSMSYGVADWLGPSDHLSTWDLVMPRFRGKDDECIFALFDGSKHPKSGCPLTKQLNDTLVSQFTKELASTKSDDTIVSAMRRVFLGLEQNLGSSPHIVDKDSGASACVCYISGTKLYVANVGDALAVISRNNGQAFEITQKHIPLNPSEVSRIRAAGGFVSNSGLLNNELNVSRSFGHFHLIPVVNCNPFVSTIDLAENDEFVILASRGLWDRMTYQTAVDIARTEKDDLMAAAQKLRDFAITYGATDNLMVMVIGVGDLFDKREKRFRNNRANNMGPGRGGACPDIGADDGLLIKSKRRGKEEVPGDSTLARLEREVAPPVSQLALVFTDIKSSTQFWETQPENMRAAIKIHDAIMRRTLRSVGGYEVKTEGDAFMVCFKNITAALLWCFTVQLQLLEADWPAGILDTEEGREIEKDGVMIYKGLSVRMGIHWGTPVSERNPITQRMDYFGPVVNKASRICNAADGGQICVSSDVIAALRNFPSMFDEDADLQTVSSNDEDTFSGTFPVSRDLVQLKQLGFHVVELGERRLKGLETPETLSLVFSKQLLGRIEIDKSEMMATPQVDPSSESAVALEDPLITESASVMDVLPSMTDIASDEYADVVSTFVPKKTRTIDANLVCAMSSLAIRLERLTSGHVLSQQNSLVQRHELALGSNGVSLVNSTPSGLSLMLDRHLRENASDEELLIMMENCVSRVENAVSSLYLQKMGHFANVLEKLGEAIDMDPMHIIKALQMYAEVSSLS
ncbi:hypothetical protein BD560DRAFT_411226 [Blakeslea trispora]|nr:hypothetical protein BD560DRAFT_411226 [Blakeslea trispora]